MSLLFTRIAAASLFCLAASAGFAADTYRLVSKDGVSWFEGPDGRRMWSFGVCCTDVGLAPKDVKPENQGYSALSIFPNEESWVQDTAKNLRNWGFNSLGGWSDSNLFTKYAGKDRLPYFTVLHLGAYDMAPWHDLFARQMYKAIDGAAKIQIEKLREDPYLVGYFTDNELGWWTDTLFITYRDMPGESPGHKAFMSVVRNHYRNNFDAFKKDWSTPAQSFEDLEKKSDMKMRAGSQGIKLVDAFTFAAASHYYKMVHDAVRRYDRKHLILGDRYCQYYDLQVVRAAKPYVDAISSNMGADWTDGGISRFFLDSLNQITGKPVIVTEFYMTAIENQSGNKNSSGGFPIVQTQRERANAFRRDVSEMAARPYMLGAHWFQYYDEPPKGRGDGEDYNMGLIDIHGKPYPLLTGVAANLNVQQRHAQAANVPFPNTAAPAPADPMKSLLNWDRPRSLVAPSKGTSFGDLYASYSKDALYVGVYSMDYADERLYEGGKMPEMDRPCLTLKVAGMKESITVRFGGDKRKASVNVPGVEVSLISELKSTVIVRIPARLLSAPLQPQTRLKIDARLATHSRAEEMGWRQEVQLIK